MSSRKIEYEPGLDRLHIHMDHSKRLQTFSAKLLELPVDYFLVTHLPNIRYLSGFTGSAGALLVGGAEPVFFTDGRYIAQAHQEVKSARVVVEAQSPLASAAQWLKKRRGEGKVGIEGDHVTLVVEVRLRSLLPKRWRLRTVSGAVERLRMVKDAAEIERLRRAVKLGSSLFGPMLKTIRPGIAESTVAAKLGYAARVAGAEGMAFDTIVAAGARSALPHGRASVTPIPRQGFVVLDFGVILAGYCSDMTRTVSVGRVPRKQQAWYPAVLEAQLAGIAAVRAGATAGKVDEAARKVLKKSSLSKYFTHSTGHGVGLEIHESPRIASGEKEVLQPGMVITIEPGIYIPGEGGVRIEDMVVVTQTGCEVLTPTTKDLISI
jgi:Xaa-Pro aminopeptidase